MSDQLFLMDENATGLFIMIKNIEADPVTLEAIKPQIVAHLLNIKRRETMQAEVSRLRAAMLDHVCERRDRRLTGLSYGV